METTTNQPISSSPSSGDDDPPAADDVTFRFNQINGNDDSKVSYPQQLIPEAKSPSSGDNDSPAADDVTLGFNHLQINGNNDDSKISDAQQLFPEASETDNEEEEEDEDDDGDFTFMCAADNDNGNGSLTAIENGQIRNAFPLFDQSLLLNGDYDDGNSRLPIEVPVDKVFIESPRRSPSDNGETDGSVRRLPIDVPVDKLFIESPRRSPSDNGETNGTGTARRLQNESEINKSNSTGFSKLWRFRNNEMNRSNSDGRDAFVFLESSDTATTATTSDGKPNGVKVNVGKGKGVKKGKKSTASAHEVYLKQKGGQTEEERRRSYLPYRPGLMGFFTNVNGGLSKNVHPF